MPTITAPGLGSGLDVNSIVSQLVAAEGLPSSQRLDRNEAELQARLSGLGTLKGAVSAFQSSLSSLTQASGFQSRSAQSSDADVASVSTNGSSAPGSFELEVTQLAEAHSLVTDSALPAAQFTALSDVLGTGTLTFKFGTTDYNPEKDKFDSPFVPNPDKAEQSVQISDGSLSGIRDAVNAADIGVNASIIFDGSNYRLVFSSSDTGAANSLEIAVTDDDADNNDASGLSLLSFNASSHHLSQTQAAQDARLSLNGIDIQSDGNTLTRTLDGVTINLLAQGTSTLSVSRDASKTTADVTAFVDSYNTLVQTMDGLSSFDPDSERAGALNGDATLRTLENQLRRMLSEPVVGSVSGFSILADIGITRNGQDGTLAIDSGKLGDVLKDNPDAVTALFAAAGRPTDSLIEFSRSSDATRGGEYAVNINQLATQGRLVGSAAANLTITGGSNDTLSVSANGVATTVTLAAGVYTAASLANEIQSKLNGSEEFQDNGVTVDVAEAAGILTLSSNQYGSASVVSITAGNGATDMFGAAPTSINGLDVTGTIGGTMATGSGQTLTGAGNAAGLGIVVSGGVTGDRGNIVFSRGYANQVNTLLDDVLASSGVLESATGGINDRIKDIGDDRDALARRLEIVEQRLFRQFNALDLLVSNLQSTSTFLTNQLAALPVIGSDNGSNQ